MLNYKVLNLAVNILAYKKWMGQNAPDTVQQDYTAKLLFHQSPTTRHSHYTVTGQ